MPDDRDSRSIAQEHAWLSSTARVEMDRMRKQRVTRIERLTVACVVVALAILALIGFVSGHFLAKVW